VLKLTGEKKLRSREVVSIDGVPRSVFALPLSSLAFPFFPEENVRSGSRVGIPG
jgi:hypothetical protein